MKTNYRLQLAGKTGVIITHGLLSHIDKDSIKSVESAFLQQNISTISFDIYGHGGSNGDIKSLTLSKCFKQIFEMQNILEKKGITVRYIYGASFSSLAVLYAGNAIGSVTDIFIKTPVLNYREKRAKELGAEAIQMWEQEGIIKITDGYNNKPDIYQSYDFIRDYDLLFSNPDFGKKNLFFAGGVLDEEVDIQELRLLSKNYPNITLKEYNTGHRFDTLSKKQLLDDIISYIGNKK